jgi:hypothetical protein
MIMSRLFKMNLGGCNRKLLAVRLADFADDEGRGIFPSVKRMASETELSERTVQRILADFVQEGILVVVRGATGRPGVANAYDFDLERLFSYNPPMTGDTVSPVEEAETGDNLAETGDTSDVDGCQGDTRTVIEPPIEPSSLSASAPARISVREERGKNSDTEDRKHIEAAFWGLVKDWPNFADADKKGPLKQWFGLSEDDRRDAVVRFPAWRATFGNRKHIPMPSTYFRERFWTNFPDPKPEAERIVVHNTFSRAWSARRFSWLIADPASPSSAPTAYQQQILKKGGPEAEAILRSRRLNHGWPRVVTMHERATSAGGVTVPPWLVRVSETFVGYHKDSAEVARWRAYHEDNDWPWLPIPVSGVDWLFFPPGQPDEAIADFRDAVARERGNDDAA